MALCPYFGVWRKQLQCRTISGTREPSFSEVKVPYCEHDHSPAPLEDVRRVLGGGQILKCAGDIAKCQLPDGMKPDT